MDLLQQLLQQSPPRPRARAPTPTPCRSSNSTATITLHTEAPPTRPPPRPTHHRQQTTSATASPSPSTATNTLTPIQPGSTSSNHSHRRRQQQRQPHVQHMARPQNTPQPPEVLLTPNVDVSPLIHALEHAFRKGWPNTSWQQLPTPDNFASDHACMLIQTCLVHDMPAEWLLLQQQHQAPQQRRHPNLLLPALTARLAHPHTHTVVAQTVLTLRTILTQADRKHQRNSFHTTCITANSQQQDTDMQKAMQTMLRCTLQAMTPASTTLKTQQEQTQPRHRRKTKTKKDLLPATATCSGSPISQHEKMTEKEASQRAISKAKERIPVLAPLAIQLISMLTCTSSSGARASGFGYNDAAAGTPEGATGGGEPGQKYQNTLLHNTDFAQTLSKFVESGILSVTAACEEPVIMLLLNIVLLFCEQMSSTVPPTPPAGHTSTSTTTKTTERGGGNDQILHIVPSPVKEFIIALACEPYMGRCHKPLYERVLQLAFRFQPSLQGTIAAANHVHAALCVENDVDHTERKVTAAAVAIRLNSGRSKLRKHMRQQENEAPIDVIDANLARITRYLPILSFTSLCFRKGAVHDAVDMLVDILCSDNEKDCCRYGRRAQELMLSLLAHFDEQVRAEAYTSLKQRMVCTSPSLSSSTSHSEATFYRVLLESKHCSAVELLKEALLFGSISDDNRADVKQDARACVRALMQALSSNKEVAFNVVSAPFRPLVPLLHVLEPVDDVIAGSLLVDLALPVAAPSSPWCRHVSQLTVEETFPMIRRLFSVNMHARQEACRAILPFACDVIEKVLARAIVGKLCPPSAPSSGHDASTTSVGRWFVDGCSNVRDPFAFLALADVRFRAKAQIDFRSAVNADIDRDQSFSSEDVRRVLDVFADSALDAAIRRIAVGQLCRLLQCNTLRHLARSADLVRCICGELTAQIASTDGMDAEKGVRSTAASLFLCSCLELLWVMLQSIGGDDSCSKLAPFVQLSFRLALPFAWHPDGAVRSVVASIVAWIAFTEKAWLEAVHPPVRDLSVQRSMAYHLYLPDYVKVAIIAPVHGVHVVWYKPKSDHAVRFPTSAPALLADLALFAKRMPLKSGTHVNVSVTESVAERQQDYHRASRQRENLLHVINSLCVLDDVGEEDVMLPLRIVQEYVSILATSRSFNECMSAMHHLYALCFADETFRAVLFQQEGMVSFGVVLTTLSRFLSVTPRSQEDHHMYSLILRFARDCLVPSCRFSHSVIGDVQHADQCILSLWTIAVQDLLPRLHDASSSIMNVSMRATILSLFQRILQHDRINRLRSSIVKADAIYKASRREGTCSDEGTAPLDLLADTLYTIIDRHTCQQSTPPVESGVVFGTLCILVELLQIPFDCPLHELGVFHKAHSACLSVIHKAVEDDVSHTNASGLDASGCLRLSLRCLLLLVRNNMYEEHGGCYDIHGDVVSDCTALFDHPDDVVSALALELISEWIPCGLVSRDQVRAVVTGKYGPIVEFIEFHFFERSNGGEIPSHSDCVSLACGALVASLFHVISSEDVEAIGSVHRRNGTHAVGNVRGSGEVGNFIGICGMLSFRYLNCMMDILEYCGDSSENEVSLHILRGCEILCRCGLVQFSFDTKEVGKWICTVLRACTGNAPSYVLLQTAIYAVRSLSHLESAPATGQVSSLLVKVVMWALCQRTSCASKRGHSANSEHCCDESSSRVMKRRRFNDAQYHLVSHALPLIDASVPPGPSLLSSLRSLFEGCSKSAEATALGNVRRAVDAYMIRLEKVTGDEAMHDLSHLSEAMLMTFSYNFTHMDVRHVESRCRALSHVFQLSLSPLLPAAAFMDMFLTQLPNRLHLASWFVDTMDMYVSQFSASDVRNTSGDGSREVYTEGYVRVNHEEVEESSTSDDQNRRVRFQFLAQLLACVLQVSCDGVKDVLADCNFAAMMRRYWYALVSVRVGSGYSMDSLDGQSSDIKLWCDIVARYVNDATGRSFRGPPGSSTGCSRRGNSVRATLLSLHAHHFKTQQPLLSSLRHDDAIIARLWKRSLSSTTGLCHRAAVVSVLCVMALRPSTTNLLLSSHLDVIPEVVSRVRRVTKRLGKYHTLSGVAPRSTSHAVVDTQMRQVCTATKSAAQIPTSMKLLLALLVNMTFTRGGQRAVFDAIARGHNFALFLSIIDYALRSWCDDCDTVFLSMFLFRNLAHASHARVVLVESGLLSTCMLVLSCGDSDGCVLAAETLNVILSESQGAIAAARNIPGVYDDLCRAHEDALSRCRVSAKNPPPGGSMREEMLVRLTSIVTTVPYKATNEGVSPVLQSARCSAVHRTHQICQLLGKARYALEDDAAGLRGHPPLTI